MAYWGTCTSCGLVRYSAAAKALESCPACGGEMRVSTEIPRSDDVAEIQTGRKGRFRRIKRARARRRG